MSDDPLEEAAQRLRTDKPCITDAMKNFTSAYAGQALAPDEHSPHLQQRPPDVAVLLAIAKIVLKVLNAHALLSVEEWAASHPQDEDESAFARIEALTNYKAAFLLAQQVAVANAKRSKLFGRQFLLATGCWPAVQAAAQDELLRQRYPTADTSAFLERWSAALTGEDAGLAELVWAEEFNTVLQARREARNEEVRERRARMEIAEDEAERLREVLGGEGGAEQQSPGAEEAEERIVEV